MAQNNHPSFSSTFHLKLGRGFYIDQCIYRTKDQLKFERIWKSVQRKHLDTSDKFTKKAKKVLQLVKQQGDAFLRDKLEIRFIDDQIGFGAFAKDDIPKGTILGEYVGMIKYLSPAEDKKLAKTNGYLFEFTDVKKLSDFVIDAKTYGNFIRFINHAKKRSKKENVESFVIFDEDAPHIIYVSKGIKKGDELRMDYGEETYWKNRKYIS
ncbi:MAG: SET domain-containing protein-lysine N-methyltransferase [Chlamydiales bacterium]|nr:SET domain-containing protein-lysine N-methyltransferase [Chlamydiales bacterium]